MEVGEVKGLMVFTIHLDTRDAIEVSQLDESQVISLAKKAISKVIPESLISDILVGHEGDRLQVAVSI